MTKIIRPSAHRVTGEDADDVELQDSKSIDKHPEEPDSSEIMQLNLQPSYQSEQRPDEGSM